MRAIEVLREANRTGAPILQKSAPTGFVRQRWAPHVLPGGAIDRRHYELCVLSELRDRLRAGDVWVAGSRQYRSFEERLISTQTLAGSATEPAHCRSRSTPISSASSRAAARCWTSGWPRSTPAPKTACCQT